MEGMKKIIMLLFLGVACMQANSQLLHCDKANFTTYYEIKSENSLLIKSVYNHDTTHYAEVYIDRQSMGTGLGRINANSSLKIDRECCNFVKVVVQGGNTVTILNAKSILKDEQTKRESSETIQIEKSSKQNSQAISKKKEDDVNSEKRGRHGEKISIEADAVIESFTDYIDTVSYYSSSYLNELNSHIDSYIDALEYMNKEQKDNYITEKQLNGYVNDAMTNLNQHKDGSDRFIDDFLNNYYSSVTIIDKQRCIDEMHNIITTKLKEREAVINKLEQAISDDSVNDNNRLMLLNISISVVLVIAVLILFVKYKQRKVEKTPTVIPFDSEQQTAQADIVVRRKTTSILKKQSLEDVIDNPSYISIDCADFCDDSAVRRIYIKNTCIKEIYNMYAEDLRNPENPNEDGCMVLGRWVHDAETDEYFVSLEETIKPGDDAVFQEYELNFGGKIKLKVSEKLRKLRKETNLQYDMTCWVHSHPGLGVFFSNADSSVQMQLKHPTHPKFLTAIVIDILTPEQELGIFTFKHDMSINSKPELKKMYSLEELYKWSVASDKNGFKPEDYYNIMKTAKDRQDSCFGIHLSNGAIIDMCQMEILQQSGFAGWIQGFKCENGSRNEFVAKSVSKEKVIPDNEAMGCFIIGSHLSIPTIRKVITEAEGVHFVLFYSTTDGLLTSIPFVDGQLTVEENYFGEEKLDELKIWTRRKR